MIYRDFDHWWSEGKHGWTSASREYAIEIWNDLKDTIEASRDSYRCAMVEAARDKLDQDFKCLDAALEYIETFKKDDAPKFWRWVLDNKKL